MENKEQNLIQMYFKEINDIYTKNDNNYEIVYCPENREQLIQMNLKSVIYIAKKYIGLGVELEDLISAGNYGLCVAFDKFDPSRNVLKTQIIELINSKPDKISFDDMSEIFELISYGSLSKKFAKDNPKSDYYDKAKLLEWVNSNIFAARFNSIASMWIRAFILQEIDNNSRLVKKPKTEIYKDKKITKSYNTEIKTELTGLETDENYEYEEVLKADITDDYNSFKNNLKLLFTGVPIRDRSVLLKKFGIGYPRPMLPKEIAEQEDLSIARISQILKSTITKMQKNMVKYNISGEEMHSNLQNITF